MTAGEGGCLKQTEVVLARATKSTIKDLSLAVSEQGTYIVYFSYIIASDKQAKQIT